MKLSVQGGEEKWLGRKCVAGDLTVQIGLGMPRCGQTGEQRPQGICCVEIMQPMKGESIGG